MTQSTKAALLSGLVFPGIGHFVLKQYVRGSILMLTALIAMSVVIRIVFQQAQAIVDRVVSGEIALDAAAISTVVAEPSSNSDSFVSSVAITVFLACWLIGIIDSYRIGNRDEVTASQ